MNTAEVDSFNAQQTEDVANVHAPAADSTVEAADVENTTAAPTRPGIVEILFRKLQVRTSPSIAAS